MSPITGQCDICDTRQSVAFGLVRWKVRDGSSLFENVSRCVDRKACRSRVEAKGQEWLVEDPQPTLPGAQR